MATTSCGYFYYEDYALSIGEVHEDFNEDNHYIGLPVIILHIAVHCCKGYMLIMHRGDETYAELVSMARALSQPNFATFSSYFRQIRVKYYRSLAQNEDVIHHYIGWGTKYTFYGG